MGSDASGRSGREARRAGAAEAPVTFKNGAAFRAWLRKHHKTEAALVVRIAKAHVASSGINYADALDEALCFGWIDGVRRRLDTDGFSIRFSPRKPASIWSLVNVRHAERLIAHKRMMPAGHDAFNIRREDRTGVYAFEQRTQILPPDLARIFRRNRAAWSYYQAEAPWYRRTTTHWLRNAKREETRQKRLAILMENCQAGLRIPQLRRP